MTDAVQIAEIGMINDLARMAFVSNNLANVGTTAFKSQIPVLQQFDSQLLDVFSLMDQGAGLPEVGQLVPTLRGVVNQTQGPLRYTGNALDVAIQGEGFFELSGPNGIVYARNGAFTRDALGRLVTASGEIVAGVGGEIRLTDAEVVIDGQGVVWAGDDRMGQLKIVSFAAPSELAVVGGGMYQPGSAGQAEVLDYPDVRQGFLEGANVTPMNEMVRMIETARHFEGLQRVVRGYDDMLGTAITTIAVF